MWLKCMGFHHADMQRNLSSVRISPAGDYEVFSLHDNSASHTRSGRNVYAPLRLPHNWLFCLNRKALNPCCEDYSVVPFLVPYPCFLSPFPALSLNQQIHQCKQYLILSGCVRLYTTSDTRIKPP